MVAELQPLAGARDHRGPRPRRARAHPRAARARRRGVAAPVRRGRPLPPPRRLPPPGPARVALRLPGGAAPRGGGGAAAAGIAARRGTGWLPPPGAGAGRGRPGGRADRTPRQPLPGRRGRDHPGQRRPEPLAAAAAGPGRAVPAAPTAAPAGPEAPVRAAAPAAVRPAEEAGPFPLSAALEAHYQRLEQERQLLEGRRRLREPLRAALARSVRALEKLAEEALRVPAAEEDRRGPTCSRPTCGWSGAAPREVAVTEWTEEGPREVRVAHRSRPRSPGQHGAVLPPLPADRGQRRAGGGAGGGGAPARVAALRALLAELEDAPLAALPRLEKEARQALGRPPPARPAPRRRDEPLPPYRSFRSLAGAAILVGRGAEQNDALTLRVARGNDLWLHARGLAGRPRGGPAGEGEGPDQETCSTPPTWRSTSPTPAASRRPTSPTPAPSTCARRRGPRPARSPTARRRSSCSGWSRAGSERLLAEEEGEEALA